MTTNALAARNDLLPSFVDDFFKPWSGLFDTGFDKKFSVPAVNISENKDEYAIAVAAPGLKKDHFKIDVSGTMLTISAEKKEEKESKEENYNRREYNYSSFSRTFTLPDDVIREKIDAHYEDGVLRLSLPKKEEAKMHTIKTIAVK